jgi:hypothetical protein
MSFNQLTDREREIIKTLGESVFWRTLTDQDWEKHLSDRVQLVEASKPRQAALRAESYAAPKEYQIAKKNRELAQAALKEAIAAEELAFQRVRGMAVAIESETYFLKKALGEGAHPDIAELIYCVEYYLDALPAALHIGIVTERNAMGQSRPKFHSNMIELGQGLDRLRFIKSELIRLGETAYGDELFGDLRLHYDNVLAIAKSFDLGNAPRPRKWVFSFLKPKTEHSALAA